MNVLIATYLAHNSPSGVVTYCRTLASELSAAGVEVHTIDTDSTPTWWRKILGLLKRVMRPLGGMFYVIYDEFAYFTGIYLATRRLRQQPIDLIHAQDVRSALAAFLALGQRVPVIVTCHFNGDPVLELVLQFNLKPGFTRQLTNWYKYLFSKVRHYIFVSEYAYTQSKHLLPADVHKQVIRNTAQLGIDDHSGHPDEVMPGRLIISNVGYVDERKNQQLLLQIGHELLNRRVTNFHLWIIGDGPKRADYTALAQQLGLVDYVTFFGRQLAPWLLVAQSDLYVHTATNDNCPYSIIEAFAVETPVLALPVGGIPEMFPEGFGLLQGTNVPELTDEIIRYFQPEARRQLAAAQALYAASEFNRQENLEKILLFYRQTIGQSMPVDVQSTHVL